MEERILSRASHHLWQALLDEGITFTEREREAYALGKLAVLLEVESIVRSLSVAGDVLDDDSLRFDASSAVRSIQSSLHNSLFDVNDDTLIEWYEMLLNRVAAASFAWPDPPPASFGAVPRSTSPPSRGTVAPDQEDTLIVPPVPEPPT